MNVYGTPPPVIPLYIAAAAVEMTPNELAEILGGRVIIVSPTKRGVRPADLEALQAGSTTGLKVILNASIGAQDCTSWG